MLDSGHSYIDAPAITDHLPQLSRRNVPKALFDLVMVALLLVPLAIVALLLVILNPLLNPGPLVFRQSRMGHECRAFTAYKFRSMSAAIGATRGAYDDLEQDRISRLGQLLRKTRFD